VVANRSLVASACPLKEEHAERRRLSPLAIGDRGASMTGIDRNLRPARGPFACILEDVLMRWTVTKTGLAETPGDLIVYPVFQKDDAADLGALLKAAGGPPSAAKGKGKSGHGGGTGLKGIIESAGFTAKAETTLPVYCGGVKAGWFLLVGMGPAQKAGLQTVRKVAGKAAREARSMKAARVLVSLPAAGVLNLDDTALARCWVEGAELALSPIGELKTMPKKKRPADPRDWKFLVEAPRHRALRGGVQEAEAMVAGCIFARHLVNLPPNILTPAELASQARRMARSEGLKCQILGVPQLKKLKMGGILGVGQGSTNPPRLIVLDYKAPAGTKVPTVALVGKGITFDSGGISLKPSAGMGDMKSDMGGAAAVLGAAVIAARLKLPVNLQVLVPTAENMPDGSAVKPADVITMASGKTVEVLNTDAEGRLILADALWYAGRSKPDYLIDAATLTGACVVALGKFFAGAMGNSGELLEILQQAGGETFERVWQLPLIDEHKEAVEGTWSDLQNIGGGREAGASTAGAFLAHFVDDSQAWAHVDIAGMALADKGTATGPKGGTGFGARLLARAIQILVT